MKKYILEKVKLPKQWNQQLLIYLVEKRYEPILTKISLIPSQVIQFVIKLVRRIYRIIRRTLFFVRSFIVSVVQFILVDIIGAGVNYVLDIIREVVLFFIKIINFIKKKYNDYLLSFEDQNNLPLYFKIKDLQKKILKRSRQDKKKKLINFIYQVRKKCYQITILFLDRIDNKNQFIKSIFSQNAENFRVFLRSILKRIRNFRHKSKQILFPIIHPIEHFKNNLRKQGKEIPFPFDFSLKLKSFISYLKKKLKLFIFSLKENIKLFLLFLKRNLKSLILYLKESSKQKLRTSISNFKQKLRTSISNFKQKLRTFISDFKEGEIYEAHLSPSSLKWYFNVARSLISATLRADYSIWKIFFEDKVRREKEKAERKKRREQKKRDLESKKIDESLRKYREEERKQMLEEYNKKQQEETERRRIQIQEETRRKYIMDQIIKEQAERDRKEAKRRQDAEALRWDKEHKERMKRMDEEIKKKEEEDKKGTPK